MKRVYILLIIVGVVLTALNLLVGNWPLALLALLCVGVNAYLFTMRPAAS